MQRPRVRMRPCSSLEVVSIATSTPHNNRGSLAVSYIYEWSADRRTWSLTMFQVSGTILS